METRKLQQRWERTSVTNLVRNGQSGGYYARVRFNSKEKWKSLKTSTLSVAKLRLADFERDLKARGTIATAEAKPGDDLTMGRFMAAYLD